MAVKIFLWKILYLWNINKSILELCWHCLKFFIYFPQFSKTEEKFKKWPPQVPTRKPNRSNSFWSKSRVQCTQKTKKKKLSRKHTSLFYSESKINTHYKLHWKSEKNLIVVSKRVAEFRVKKIDAFGCIY